ncbi:hypothetical protein [Rhodococcus tukisamuensis]|uniref:hypothetical protein n=1 Tax=Rhodococcus tukisamuensis TaxID=168276 RepID=UPI001FDF8170|nr:hypothetical protein [Rhodococcus tukisamuensis]
MTFTAKPPTPAYYSCLDVTVHWLNLTTGAAGTTALRRVPPDNSRRVPQDEWCRYVPSTAVTGSGTIAATADVGAVALWAYQILVTPGVGIIPVP